ncbi:hypothetical protein [Kitasatospora sp. NPDC058190]|uniref:hypothetical protein n=1 Tax=Kitasatospora sp. NPDC058190 TaxID=3346371 RepID=UPI0036DAA38E
MLYSSDNSPANPHRPRTASPNLVASAAGGGPPPAVIALSLGLTAALREAAKMLEAADDTADKG